MGQRGWQGAGQAAGRRPGGQAKRSTARTSRRGWTSSLWGLRCAPWGLCERWKRREARGKAWRRRQASGEKAARRLLPARCRCRCRCAPAVRSRCSHLLPRAALPVIHVDVVQLPSSIARSKLLALQGHELSERLDLLSSQLPPLARTAASHPVPAAAAMVSARGLAGRHEAPSPAPAPNPAFQPPAALPTRSWNIAERCARTWSSGKAPPALIGAHRLAAAARRRSPSLVSPLAPPLSLSHPKQGAVAQFCQFAAAFAATAVTLKSLDRLLISLDET